MNRALKIKTKTNILKIFIPITLSLLLILSGVLGFLVYNKQQSLKKYLISNKTANQVFSNTICSLLPNWKVIDDVSEVSNVLEKNNSIF